MKKPKTSPKNASPCVFDLPARIALAVKYHHRAEGAAHLMAVWGALSGLELQAIKKEQGHGAWTQFYAEHIEAQLPLRTAQYYMQVAEGLKLKTRRAVDGELSFAPPEAELAAFLAKHQAKVDRGAKVQLIGHFERRYTGQIWKLIQKAPCQLSDGERTRLAAAVEAIADGETMASLIEAYRISKKPAGAGATGGYKPDPERVQVYLRAYQPKLVGTLYADLPEEVQAAFRKWVAAEGQDEMQMALNFCAPVLNLFEDPEFERAVGRIPITKAETMLAHAEALVIQLKERLKKEARRAA